MYGWFHINPGSAFVTDFMLHRDTLTVVRPKLDIDHLPLIIFVNKGIESGTHALSLEIIADTCGKEVAKVCTFIVSTVISSSVFRYN